MMLVELLVAMAVAAVALVGLTSLISRSVADASFFRHKTEATALAREGIEWVKSQKQAQGFAFIDGKKGASYCINTLNWVAGVCSGTIPGTTLYTRSLTLLSKTPATNPPKLVVTVTVVWAESRKVYNAALTTELTNY